ncbi:hypothetical protein AJ80_02739 [Polytolypa hystricis UAMH7299]|uniref:Uncharacterized protein n=1 Tax=Polytolypa hystricis (strain UAMH7299) TaxID=1447883 RepID=A0A2B7YQ95_POLH7|nr:hypothetical protein AJ80_02739 [Polytolypa hystricis UAMH7299]
MSQCAWSYHTQGVARLNPQMTTEQSTSPVAGALATPTSQPNPVQHKRPAAQTSVGQAYPLIAWNNMGFESAWRPQLLGGDTENKYPARNPQEQGLLVLTSLTKADPVLSVVRQQLGSFQWWEESGYRIPL